MAYQSYEQLEVWKRATRLAVDVCRAVPRGREFGLRDPMCRASVSVPSNIAEGAERDSRLDYIRFLRIAKGSSAELRTQLHIASELGVLEPSVARRFHEEARQIAAMLQGLIRALRARSTADSLPISTVSQKPPAND